MTRFAALCAATLGFAACLSAARAESYTLFIYESPAELAHRTDAGPAGQAYWGAYAGFAQAAAQAGVMRGGSALDVTPDAVTTVRASGAAEGPFATAPLVLGGYFQIEVPDLATARTWAAKLPAAETGAIEIRRGAASPAMAP